ncbi:LamG-like jellyroll fold domain-containing protein [Streptomyces sp. NPDC048018]|uniref:LamG-like jellyroll fold domain-containing protein n=1 Tax=Streptomyces sp. NPDC048018 TaxID=3365499 RepID=UPI0037193530
MRPDRERWRTIRSATCATAVACLISAVSVLPGGASVALAADASAVGVTDGKEKGRQQPEAADTPESLAVEKAKKSGKPVDVGSMRTEFSEVTARPDGTLESVTHTQPVRTRKAGAWVDIDTTLKRVTEGMVEPRATLSDLAFSGGGDKPLVRMTRAGKVLELTWPEPLPEPRLNGETATYASVLPGVDLRLTATRTGFNQLLVVKTPEAAKNPELDRIRIGLNADGLSLRENPDGALVAVDKAAGGTVFTAPEPMMYDSSAAAKDGPGKPVGQTAAPAARAVKSASALAGATAVDAPAADGAHAAQVGIELSSDGQGTGGEDAMVLTPSRALLDAPGTVYPVLIDPAWDTPHTSAWAGISRTNGSQPYYKFTYNSTYVKDFGTGYCESPGCSAADVKRVYYRIPVTSKFAGKHILSAEFNVYESHSYSCTAKPVQLYLTKSIGSGTTWNNSTTAGFWQTWLQTLTAAKGWSSSCAAGYLEFGATGVKNVVQQAANGGWSNITFGLKAENESDAGAWKRFTDDASLRVNYNLPPRQIPMKSLTMSPGSVCLSTGVTINRFPQITAVATDPDNEKIGVQFAVAWDSGDGGGHKRRWWSTGAEGTAPASSTFKASGSPFSVTLPTSVPKNVWVGWESRAWDGAEWGPWSSYGDPTACYIMIDTTFPDGPDVSSVEFPGGEDQSDTLPWTDGVGRYGNFKIDSLAADVVKYEYGLDTGPSAANSIATTNGDPRSASLLLDTPGPHFLSVRSIDGAGNASQPETYYFNVLTGHPQRAGWAMDEQPGATTLAGSESTFETTAGAGVTSGPGRDGSGSAVSMSYTADGYLTTDRAVVETDRSFTFSGWAKPVGIVPTRNTAVITQNGQHQSITMGLIGDKWAIKAPSVDALSGYTWFTAQSTTPAVEGKWTHLTGVYDSAAHTLKMYVDGVVAASIANVNMWSARGAMTFGLMKWKDNPSDAWSGSIDDIAVYDRALGAAEVNEAAAGRPVTTGLPAKAVWTLDEPTTGLMFGRSEKTTATLQNGASIITDGASGKGVHLDGTDDFITTTRPQVDGTRSFSVSAWVRMADPTDMYARMIANQRGVHQSEFLLYYSAYANKWIFGRYTEDSSTASLISVGQQCTAGTAGCIGPADNQWTHVLGVSDAKTNKLRLFVNGYLMGEVPYTQTKPWASPGGLQIGAVNREGVNGEFLGGDVDDVRVYDRVVTADEAHAMVQQRPQLGARWKFNTASGTPKLSPDDAGKSVENAQLNGDATVNATGGAVAGADGNPSGSLVLDGDGDYAATTAMPIHTGQSFSVAGWVQQPTAPNRDMTALSIAGTKQSAVEVGWDYVKDVDGIPVGQWRVSVTDADGSTSTRKTAVHTFDSSMRTGFNHLAVVYDAFADQLSLYVNGALENQICSDEDTSGTCTDHVSWTSAPQPFEATGQVQFGRDLSNGTFGSYFSGEIDDVWMFQGALSPAQVISLGDPSVELSSSSAL